MPRAKKHTIKFINVPIFNDEYNVIICFGDEAETRRVMETVGHENAQICWNHDKGVTMLTPGVTPVIAMPKKPETDDERGTLAHEACHAIEEIFNFIGQPVGGEVFAHSVGAVVRAAGKEPETLVVTEH